VALGFADRLSAGPVGIVSAAGTGLQEVSSLLSRHGVGITQGLGVGGRDLSEAVGGLMMVEALKALQADPATQVIVLISKPPAPAVAGTVLARVAAGNKPTVVCFLGGDPGPASAAGAIPACTLQEAALFAAQAAGAALAADEIIERETRDLKSQAEGLRPSLNADSATCGDSSPAAPCATRPRSSGAICWRSRSSLTHPWMQPFNSRTQRAAKVTRRWIWAKRSSPSGGLTPMIDNDLRIRRLLQEAGDPLVAVIVLDVVLGYGAHPDPASELGPAVHQARLLAASRAAS